MSEHYPGAAIAVGATNTRSADILSDGSPTNFNQQPTPGTPNAFFAFAARYFLASAERGAEWGVMGVPGPVSTEFRSDGRVKQRFQVTNIEALRAGFDPVHEMKLADPAFGDLVTEGGFIMVVANDGDKHAEAAATLYGSGYNTVGAIASGTGVGTALVRLDTAHPDAKIFHPDPGYWELGHDPIDQRNPSETIETQGSGTGMYEMTGKPAEEVDDDDPAWDEVGMALGSAATKLGYLGGAQLVVISGSHGIHGYYEGQLRDYLAQFRETNPMGDKVPEVMRVPREPRNLTQQYELFGAQGIIRSHVVQRAGRMAIMEHFSGTPSEHIAAASHRLIAATLRASVQPVA